MAYNVELLKEKVIGHRLRELRGDKTQREIANAVGVSPMAICQYEAGTRVPSDRIKIALAEYFNRTVEEIFFTF
jgi:DNA-binding XRE family transcriptional regulator